MNDESYWLVPPEYDMNKEYTHDYKYDRKRVLTLVKRGVLKMTGYTTKQINEDFNVSFTRYEVVKPFKATKTGSVFNKYGEKVEVGKKIYAAHARVFNG